MKKLNKEEFIEQCKNNSSLIIKDLENNTNIVWDQSKLEIARQLGTPYDYYDAIEDYIEQ
jgi:hypothetical protein